jgi:glutamyl-tRNA synthetase/glutamyl-Q tRNA(Asp) synthetase
MSSIALAGPRSQGQTATRDLGRSATERCRFAPTTSGPAHPGTLLAALLCWLDARHRGAAIELRLEDIDATRCTPQSAQDMRDALAWFGLEWDSERLQSEGRDEHATALDRLAERECLYPCDCSRSAIKQLAEPAADGGFRYPGTCRKRPLPAGGWRAVEGAVRMRLPVGRIDCQDESGLELSQNAEREMGDPVLVRRDGSFAYHLACVADDASSGITRVVRGRDLAASTAIHRTLQQHLRWPTPVYRHHFLLLEADGAKFAKFHGAVGWRPLREQHDAPHWCGQLAHFAGLVSKPQPLRPQQLIDSFDWQRVRDSDLALSWTGRELAPATPGSDAASVE